MNYYELRSIVSRIIPRFTQLLRTRQAENAVREKGRKSGYQQFNLKQQEWVKQERLLNTEEINSFLEISIRAQACPMPLNIDTYDALLCPFNCIYCFPSGTPILMADGTEKVIERVKEGDRVMSFNEQKGEVEPATVTQKMKRPYRGELICIETENGNILRMTPEHPVYTQRGWTEAKELTERDEVLIW